MKNMRLLFVLLFTLVASFLLGNVFAAGVTTAGPTITGEETVHPGASGSTGAVGGYRTLIAAEMQCLVHGTKKPCAPIVTCTMRFTVWQTPLAWL